VTDTKLRFVCTGEGRHRERTLATVVYVPEAGRTLPVAERGTGGLTPPAHPAAPVSSLPRRARRSQNEMQFGKHLRDDVGLDRSDADAEQFRVRLECPHCRPLPVLAGSTVDEFVRALDTSKGGTYTVDVSTGAPPRWSPPGRRHLRS
jgi:hypothetical protein